MNERGEVETHTDYFGPKSGKVKRSDDDLKRFRPSGKQNRLTQGNPAIGSGFWVITAAHCTSSDAGGQRYSKNILVGVGSTRPENTQKHDIAAIIEHPGMVSFFKHF